jgi:uncharacterized damage-inducible protein DinB
LRSQVEAHLIAVMAAHRDFADNLPDEALARDLGVRSNSVGSQFWCVVGARESFARAIELGTWAGFQCSLGADDIHEKEAILAGLDRAGRQVVETLARVEWTEDRDELLLNLLDHEYQHQGQLIRYGYALEMPFPPSWKERWGLSDPGE